MQRKKTAMVDVASLLFLKGHVWVMRQVKIHPKPAWVGVHWDVNYLGYFFFWFKMGYSVYPQNYTPSILSTQIILYNPMYTS